MTITKITFARTVNTGNYENFRIECEAEVNTNINLKEVIEDQFEQLKKATLDMCKKTKAELK